MVFEHIQSVQLNDIIDMATILRSTEEFKREYDVATLYTFNGDEIIGYDKDFGFKQRIGGVLRMRNENIRRLPEEHRFMVPSAAEVLLREFKLKDDVERPLCALQDWKQPMQPSENPWLRGLLRVGGFNLDPSQEPGGARDFEILFNDAELVPEDRIKQFEESVSNTNIKLKLQNAIDTVSGAVRLPPNRQIFRSQTLDPDRAASFTLEGLQSQFNKRNTSFSVDVGIAQPFGFNRIWQMRGERGDNEVLPVASGGSADGGDSAAGGDSASDPSTEGKAAAKSGSGGDAGTGDDDAPDYTVVLIRAITDSWIPCVPFVCGGFQAKSEKEIMIPADSAKCRIMGISKYRSNGLKRMLLTSSWRDAAWSMPAFTLNPDDLEGAKSFRVWQVDMVISAKRTPKLPRQLFHRPYSLVKLSAKLSDHIDKTAGISVVDAIGHCSHVRQLNYPQRSCLITAQFGEENCLATGVASDTWMQFFDTCLEFCKRWEKRQRDDREVVNGCPFFALFDFGRLEHQDLPGSNRLHHVGVFEHTTDPIGYSAIGTQEWMTGLLSAAPGVFTGEGIPAHNLTTETIRYIKKYVSRTNLVSHIRTNLRLAAQSCCLGKNTHVWWAVHLSNKGAGYDMLSTSRKVADRLNEHAMSGGDGCEVPLFCSTSGECAVESMGIWQMLRKHEQEEEGKGGKGSEDSDGSKGSGGSGGSKGSDLSAMDPTGAAAASMGSGASSGAGEADPGSSSPSSNTSGGSATSSSPQSSGREAEMLKAIAPDRHIVLVRIRSMHDHVRCLPMYTSGFQAEERRTVALWDARFMESSERHFDGTVTAFGQSLKVRLVTVYAIPGPMYR
jgi:hypothetical protein